MKTLAKMVLGVIVLIIIGGVLFFGHMMNPVGEGTSAGFWNRVCGDYLGGNSVATH